MEMESGWGYIEAPAEYKEKILDFYHEIEFKAIESEEFEDLENSEDSEEQEESK
jgi:hypothetical protein